MVAAQARSGIAVTKHENAEYTSPQGGCPFQTSNLQHRHWNCFNGSLPKPAASSIDTRMQELPGPCPRQLQETLVASLLRQVWQARRVVSAARMTSIALFQVLRFSICFMVLQSCCLGATLLLFASAPAVAQSVQTLSCDLDEPLLGWTASKQLLGFDGFAPLQLLPGASQGWRTIQGCRVCGFGASGRRIQGLVLCVCVCAEKELHLRIFPPRICACTILNAIAGSFNSSSSPPSASQVGGTSQSHRTSGCGNNMSTCKGFNGTDQPLGRSSGEPSFNELLHVPACKLKRKAQIRAACECKSLRCSSRESLPSLSKDIYTVIARGWCQDCMKLPLEPCGDFVGL